MHVFLKLHHNCDVYNTWAYKRNEKVPFLLGLKIGKRRLAACLLHNVDIAVVSECLGQLRAQFPIQSPDICIGRPILRIDPPISIINGVAVIFALLASNVIQSFVAVENNPMRFCIRLV